MPTTTIELDEIYPFPATCGPVGPSGRRTPGVLNVPFWGSAVVVYPAHAYGEWELSALYTRGWNERFGSQSQGWEESLPPEHCLFQAIATWLQDYYADEVLAAINADNAPSY